LSQHEDTLTCDFSGHPKEQRVKDVAGLVSIATFKHFCTTISFFGPP